MIIYKFRPGDHVYVGPVEVPDGPTIPRYHTWQAPPEQAGHYAVMRNGWVLVKGMVPPEPTPLPPDIAGAIRAERNAKLAESDWTQLDDSPVTNAKKLEWASYRHALRDVPQQPGFPWDVQWPTQPE